MDRTSLLSAAIALCCVFALGTAAATLNSTLATDPDDVLDLDWRQLPLSNEEAESIKNEIKSNEQSPQGAKAEAPTSSGGDERGPGGGEGDSLGPTQAQQAAGGLAEAMGLGPDKDLIDELLDLLPLLLLALGVLVGTVLLYRYRDRLKALVWRLLGLGTAVVPNGGRFDRSAAARAEYAPEHEVDRAWLRLVRELSLEPVRNRTPKEVASLAKSEGMAPGAVDRLTRTFEEVRYGGKPVDDERARRAREELAELGLGGRST